MARYRVAGALPPVYPRVWSDDDAILILKAMLDYTNKKGEDSIADMNPLYDFILKHLHVSVSKSQVADKVRRLKSKYKNNLSKAKQGEDWSLSKPHEQEAFELSKKIWGGGDQIVHAPFMCELVRLSRAWDSPGLGGHILKRGPEFLGGAEKAERLERRRKILVADMEAKISLLDFTKKGTDLILQEIRSLKN